MKKATVLARFFIWRLKNISNKNFILILSFFIGILGGLIALFLKTSVFYLRKLLLNEQQFDYQNYLLLIFPTIGILLVVLFGKYILKDNSTFSITSILFAISRKNSLIKLPKIFSSIIGGVLTAGFGGSIGLEAPIISSGAALGSNIGRYLRLDYKNVTLLLACGSAATMSAIFNTPIAAVVFAFEVLFLDLSRFSLTPLLLASVTGTIVTRLFYTDALLFDFPLSEHFEINAIPFYIVFAVLTGLLAVYFNKIFLFIESKFKKIKKQSTKIIFAAIILGVLIFIFPPLFGEGFQTIKILFDGNYEAILNNSIFYLYKDNLIIVIAFFIILIFIKVIATATTMSSGGVGGIIAPSLFTGAIAGFIFSFTINMLNIGVQLSVSNFILIGMASVLAGVLHAPLTSLFLIAEITGGYYLIVPLMLCVIISFVTVKFFHTDSIITIHLTKKGSLITHHKDKAVLKFIDLKQIIDTDFHTIDVDANLGELVKIIKKAHRNNFPVINNSGELLGVIALDSIRKIMFDENLYETTKVRNLMLILPVVIQADDTVEIVAEKFITTGVWNLAVVDNGKYVGFVSKSKLFSVYRKKLVDISSD